jgi:SAM-dependent methyltransferase
MVTIHCALCKEKELPVELYPASFNPETISNQTYIARRTPDQTHFRMVKCTNCGLIFSNPILSEEFILQKYADSLFEFSSETSYLADTYYEYLKKILANFSDPTKISLVEIGCANGFFLKKVREFGLENVSGIDPSIESVQQANIDIKNKILIGTLDENSYPPDSIDIICCFHTLDHIIDINQFLNQVHRILKPGGYALFIVHDTEGLTVKLFGQRSPIFILQHIYLFNKKNLAMLFKSHNFSINSVFDVQNRFPLNYWLRMMPIHSGLKNVVRKITQLLSLETTAISLKAGNIGIICRK